MTIRYNEKGQAVNAQGYVYLGNDRGEGYGGDEQLDKGFEADVAAAGAFDAMTQGEMGATAGAVGVGLVKESASDLEEGKIPGTSEGRGEIGQGKASASEADGEETGEGEAETEKPEKLDSKLTRESLELVFKAFKQFDLEPTKPEYKNLLNQMMKEINDHQEIWDDAKKQEEILKLLAVGIWRDLMKEMGVAKVVDVGAEAQEVVKKIKSGMWEKNLTSEELSVLRQEKRDRAVGQRFAWLVSRTATQGGQPVQVGSSEWMAIAEAYGKRAAKGDRLVDKAGDRMLLLTAIGEKLRQLEDGGQLMEGGELSATQEAWIDDYVKSGAVNEESSVTQTEEGQSESTISSPDAAVTETDFVAAEQEKTAA